MDIVDSNSGVLYCTKVFKFHSIDSFFLKIYDFLVKIELKSEKKKLDTFKN